MAVQLYSGLPLIVNGQVAVDPRCCCTPVYPCNVCLPGTVPRRVRLIVTGILNWGCTSCLGTLDVWLPQNPSNPCMYQVYPFAFGCESRLNVWATLSRDWGPPARVQITATIYAPCGGGDMPQFGEYLGVYQREILDADTVIDCGTLSGPMSRLSANQPHGLGSWYCERYWISDTQYTTHTYQFCDFRSSQAEIAV